MEKSVVKLDKFINEHGWISYSEFNQCLIDRGFEITELNRHNQTDGEVHFRYLNKSTNKFFDFNGNYWNGSGFSIIIDWLNENEL